MANRHAELFSKSIHYQSDLLRNIPSIRQSQNLFDDLSSDPADWAIAIAAETRTRISTNTAIIDRPFDYGSVISYSFDCAHWQATRFSDGARFGVWYGSLDLKTTVYETAWHWSQFVRDSYASEDREIITERRVFDVRCDAVLIDLRGREIAHPDLISRTDYASTHELGQHTYDQGLNGLLYRSARCEGDNAAVFKAERLSMVRDRTFLTYRLNLVRDRFLAEREPGQKWLTLAPSSLG